MSHSRFNKCESAHVPSLFRTLQRLPILHRKKSKILTVFSKLPYRLPHLPLISFALVYSSQSDLLVPQKHQTHSFLFALAILSAWNACLPDLHVAQSLISTLVRSSLVILKQQFLSFFHAFFFHHSIYDHLIL